LVAAEGLTEEQAQIQNIAQDFSRNELSPNMSSWDMNEEFPVSTLRKAAELGFAGFKLPPMNTD
jgi:alkylation response protein AidB-like acyl-CoA dehydrogenase